MSGAMVGLLAVGLVGGIAFICIFLVNEAVKMKDDRGPDSDVQ